jgi:hypothetical protein
LFERSNSNEIVIANVADIVGPKSDQRLRSSRRDHEFDQLSVARSA